MPKHFGEFLAAGHSSPGVFLVKRRLSTACDHKTHAVS
jgi:hypothetical protein